MKTTIRPIQITPHRARALLALINAHGLTFASDNPEHKQALLEAAISARVRSIQPKRN